MTIEIRALHHAHKLGFNGHAREHAHAAAAGVADRNNAYGRPDGAENDASDLPRCCEALLTTKRNPEHEPVRQYVRPHMSLTEDVSSFETEEGMIEVASPHQLSREPDLLLEHLLVPRVYAMQPSGLASPDGHGRRVGSACPRKETSD
jgi:hypothetical protein